MAKDTLFKTSEYALKAQEQGLRHEAAGYDALSKGIMGAAQEIKEIPDLAQQRQLGALKAMQLQNELGTFHAKHDAYMKLNALQQMATQTSTLAAQARVDEAVLKKQEYEAQKDYRKSQRDTASLVSTESLNKLKLDVERQRKQNELLDKQLEYAKLNPEAYFGRPRRDYAGEQEAETEATRYERIAEIAEELWKNDQLLDPADRKTEEERMRAAIRIYEERMRMIRPPTQSPAPKSPSGTDTAARIGQFLNLGPD